MKFDIETEFEDFLAKGAIRGLTLGATSEEIGAQFGKPILEEEYSSESTVVRYPGIEFRLLEKTVASIEILVWQEGFTAEIWGMEWYAESELQSFCEALTAAGIEWAVDQEHCRETQIGLRLHTSRVLVIYDLYMSEFTGVFLGAVPDN